MPKFRSSTRVFLLSVVVAHRGARSALARRLATRAIPLLLRRRHDQSSSHLRRGVRLRQSQLPETDTNSARRLHQRRAAIASFFNSRALPEIILDKRKSELFYESGVAFWADKRPQTENGVLQHLLGLRHFMSALRAFNYGHTPLKRPLNSARLRI